MAFSRYLRDRLRPDGKGLSMAGAVAAIRQAINSGQVSISQEFVTTQADRLDTIAGAIYGDGRYWWIIAAASNVGWGLQVPPGTVIRVPNLQSVERIVG